MPLSHWQVDPRIIERPWLSTHLHGFPLIFEKHSHLNLMKKSSLDEQLYQTIVKT